jgi:nucleoside-diphosphate-sugar epimerase
MRTALVVGGTGPTGPDIVRGLLDRDYHVTVLHGGQHEVPLPQDVQHIHADPHFQESLVDGVGDRRFDLVVAQYGRLRLVADVFRGRTERLIAVGGATGSTAAATDGRWPGLGRPVILDEATQHLEVDPHANKFGHRMAEAERALFRAHAAGDYVATYLAYPIVYGPRQIQPQDWCVVRRLLDGRRRIVVADGGQKLESRLFVRNAVAALLRAVDAPESGAGQKFLVTDDEVHTIRQRIEFTATVLGVDDLELVDIPYLYATPSRALLRHEPQHRVVRNDKARGVLGYTPVVDAATALRETVAWLVANPPAPGGEEEARLQDRFDYPAEDALIDAWHVATAGLAAVAGPDIAAVRSHPYRHPKSPEEGWAPRDPAST